MRSKLQVLIPANTQDLTVLETAEVELGLTEPDSSNDAQIVQLIHQVSAAVASYCGRVFGEETVAETFWSSACGEGINSIVLDRTPITAVISVELDGSELGTGDYDLDERNGVLYFQSLGCSCSRRWFRSLVVTYKAGYPLLDGVPHDLERAALILMRDQYNAVGRDPNMRSETIPGVHSYTLGDASSASSSNVVNPQIAGLLDPYRRFPL
jgi:hypothetical protein